MCYSIASQENGRAVGRDGPALVRRVPRLLRGVALGGASLPNQRLLLLISPARQMARLDILTAIMQLRCSSWLTYRAFCSQAPFSR